MKFDGARGARASSPVSKASRGTATTRIAPSRTLSQRPAPELRRLAGPWPAAREHDPVIGDKERDEVGEANLHPRHRGRPSAEYNVRLVDEKKNGADDQGRCDASA